MEKADVSETVNQDVVKKRQEPSINGSINSSVRSPENLKQKAMLLPVVQLQRRRSNDLLLAPQEINVLQTGITMDDYEKEEAEMTLWQKFDDRFKLKPHSARRISWDFLVLTILGYLSFVTPFRVGFEYDATKGSFGYYLEMIVDFIFIFDLGMNFRTGYYRENGTIELASHRIARNYLKGYFFIDLISSFPWEWFMGDVENLTSTKVLKATKVMKISRMLKLAKLARLLKMQIFVDRLSENFRISHTKLKLISLVFCTFFTAHWNACGWAFVSRISGTYYMDSWALSYGMVNAVLGTEYLAAMYWSITTMTTVGYGDLVPQSDLERLYCIFSMVCSGGFYGFIIATLAALIQYSDANDRLVSEKMDSINSYMLAKGFPKPLFRKVRNFYKYYYEQKTAFNEEMILGELSSHLRIEVALFLMDKTVKQLTLFKDFDNVSLSKIVLILNPLIADEGDCICQHGEKASDLHIVISGQLTVSDEHDELRCMLGPGAYFGELCALGISLHRTSSLTATSSVVELYSLTKNDLFEIFSECNSTILSDIVHTACTSYDDIKNGNTKVSCSTFRDGAEVIEWACIIDDSHRERMADRAKDLLNHRSSKNMRKDSIDQPLLESLEEPNLGAVREQGDGKSVADDEEEEYDILKDSPADPLENNATHRTMAEREKTVPNVLRKQTKPTDQPKQSPEMHGMMKQMIHKLGKMERAHDKLVQALHRTEEKALGKIARLGRHKASVSEIRKRDTKLFTRSRIARPSYDAMVKHDTLTGRMVPEKMELHRMGFDDDLKDMHYNILLSSMPGNNQGISEQSLRSSILGGSRRTRKSNLFKNISSRKVNPKYMADDDNIMQTR